MDQNIAEAPEASSTKSAANNLSCNDLENEFMSFDPMSYDFKLTTTVANYAEKTSKDIPCRFHDGFSGRCWKGTACRYGHKPFTGGLFAEENPTWSAAANYVREVTSVINLAPEPILGCGTKLKCQVIYVKSPSEFFVRPNDGGCIHYCYENTCKQTHNNQESHFHAKESIDSHAFGFSKVGAQVNPQPIRSTTSDRLCSFLAFNDRYRSYQSGHYFSNAELVAVRVRLRWNRALVQKYNKNGTIRLQLLDTGEELDIDKQDVCRLPDKFCGFPPDVVKCCLYGVSPVLGRWSKKVTTAFKEVVEGKDVMIIVENRKFKNGNFSIFEKCPYYVSVFTACGDKEARNDNVVDVAENLVTRDLALKWSRTVMH